MADSPLVTLVADFAAASDFEKKHTPFITLGRSTPRSSRSPRTAKVSWSMSR